LDVREGPSGVTSKGRTFEISLVDGTRDFERAAFKGIG
jgi:hypothetical protein